MLRGQRVRDNFAAKILMVTDCEDALGGDEKLFSLISSAGIAQLACMVAIMEGRIVIVGHRRQAGYMS